MATKAQCSICKLRFEWEKALKIKNLHCPECKNNVKRITKKSLLYKLWFGIFPTS